MSSAIQTTHIGLNQWVGTEYPKRQDYVDDNKKIDDKFIEVDEQLAAIEQEIDVLEATLSQDYKSIYSTGTGKDASLLDQDFSNKCEGQSDIKLEGLTVNNLLVNGDASNGTTGYGSSNATISAFNNELTMLASAQNGFITAPYSKFSLNKKYYISVLLKGNSNLVTVTRSGTTLGSGLSHSGSGKYERLSIIYTSDVTGNYGLRITDTRTSAWDNINIKDFTCVCLDDLELDTLTLEQLNFMNDHYINGLQGTGSHKIVSVGKNLFDKTKATLGYRQDENGNLMASATTSTSDYIRIKPNTAYYYFGNDGNGRFICYFDSNKTFISSATYTINQSNITPSNARYVRFSFATALIDSVQLEEGTVATTYEPYQSSELNVKLPRQLHRVPNGVVDTVEEVNEVQQVAYRNIEYTLQASDITSLTTTTTNIDYLTILKRNDDMFFNSTIALNNNLYFPNFITGIYGDSTSKIGILFNNANGSYGLIVAKGTYANLAAAQTALAGTKIIYQLSVPVTYVNGTNGFSVTGNLEVFKEGTVYIEPTTLSQCTNPKTYITYSLSDKAVVLGNSGELTAMSKFLSTRTILESGSNANGVYIKYADGTLMCHNNNAVIVTDPATFVGTPVSLESGKLKIGRWK